MRSLNAILVADASEDERMMYSIQGVEGRG